MQKITNIEDHDNFIENNDHCVMYFVSNKCRKCADMKPILNDISKNYPNIKFSIVDVTQTTVENLDQELPVVVCYKNNSPISKVIGVDKKTIINMIDKNFKNISDNNLSAMIEINNINDFNNFLLNNKKCVAFFGTQKCGHCRNIRPFIEDISNKYKSVKFAHIEITYDTQNIIPQQYRNTGFPLIIYYKDNKVISNVLGDDKDAITKMLKDQSL